MINSEWSYKKGLVLLLIFHLNFVMEIIGFEPMTFYLQNRHSTNWVIFPRTNILKIILEKA